MWEANNGRGSAPCGPGIEPRWTRGSKLAVGTAYSTSSRLWYTLDIDCVTEVYYPTIDTPQIRDLQFLFTDGETFFHDERRNLISEVECLDEAALGFEVLSKEKEGRYLLRKTILGDRRHREIARITPLRPIGSAAVRRVTRLESPNLAKPTTSACRFVSRGRPDRYSRNFFVGFLKMMPTQSEEHMWLSIRCADGFGC